LVPLFVVLTVLHLLKDAIMKMLSHVVLIADVATWSAMTQRESENAVLNVVHQNQDAIGKD
jgi:hypothetical protein